MHNTISMKENKDFRRLYASKNNCVTPNFVIYCKRNRLEVNRLGLTVSTKLGCAVIRNRIKRRIREVYRINEHRLKKPYDIVIVARARAGVSKYSYLANDFDAAVSKLGLLID